MSPVMALRKQYQEEFQAAHNDNSPWFYVLFCEGGNGMLKRFPTACINRRK